MLPYQGEWGTPRLTPHAAEELLAEAGTAVAVADRLAGPDDIYCGA